ncbi:ABC transporter ATP-binding protein [Listeria innocua]|uniref:ATP-binding cassette domain-containing protein n=1 Tax=Listeria innocua TaxID=1642 RepID=UPI00086A6E1E|nr:ABC transporter ATP-binding protein [Listeria innocua]EAH3474168.1 ABC transporter ATP-binding protein [Listeria monocytogenes]EHE1063242.1 ABC transporter ATP-binding protein [Listeria monocytogenes]MBF2435680.1 ABC transporter ATP-binding protein [Listeria innocua]MDG0898345.1 ABC transporter ATP-binding protein [Listeria innocua]MDH4595448.1 ABC transporter ATP-binding protein [Listeria innocua]
MKNITIENMEFHYGNKNQKVFNGLNLDFVLGEKYGLVGDNGTGKTTFLYILAGMYLPTNGKIMYDGEKLEEKKIKKEVSLIPYNNSLYPYLDALDHIDLVAELWEIKENYTNYKRKVIDYLDQLNLDYKNKKVEAYSSGMQYKLYLALMLARDASLLVLDEPFTMLDKTSQILAMDMIKEKKDMMVVFSSHQTEITNYLASKVINFNEIKGVESSNEEN